MEVAEHDKRRILEYMAGQGPDDEVTHLEEVATHRILGNRYDIWDVHTDGGNWWVITSPTNLYSQEAFDSMDFALTFHIGLTTRVMAQNRPRLRRRSKTASPGRCAAGSKQRMHSNRPMRRRSSRRWECVAGSASWPSSGRLPMTRWSPQGRHDLNSLTSWSGASTSPIPLRAVGVPPASVLISKPSPRLLGSWWRG